MHKWYYCEQCNCPSVLCGKCGNNACNGGEGCDKCKEAYEIYVSKENCPREFILREEVESKIFSINDIEDLKNMLCRNLTRIEVNAILEQIEHLSD